MAWEIAKKCHNCGTRIHFSPYCRSIDWADDYSGTRFQLFAKDILRILKYCSEERGVSFKMIQFQYHGSNTVNAKKIQDKWENIDPANYSGCTVDSDGNIFINFYRENGNERRDQDPS